MKTVIHLVFLAGLTVFTSALATDGNISRAERSSPTGALSKEKKSPSDIQIYGEFKDRAGYAAWRPGLTLRDAIDKAGGFEPVAHGVRIYVRDDVTNKRLDVTTRNIRMDPKILDFRLQEGDSVNAWTQY